ncbi:MAG TPA: hypothetical protein VGC74_16680 [Stenotrophomonas sp.]|jgi:hypothetical protein
MSELTSALARAFEGPHDRAAEAAVAGWLSAPELGSLRKDLAQMSLPGVRDLGATLESVLLLGVVPASAVLAEVVQLATARAHPSNQCNQPIQRRWGVQKLAFDPSRLRQRLRETAALLVR